MNYSQAIELLGLTTPKSLEKNAKLAAGQLSHMNFKTPLRYKVAAQIVIDAAKE